MLQCNHGDLVTMITRPADSLALAQDTIILGGPQHLLITPPLRHHTLLTFLPCSRMTCLPVASSLAHNYILVVNVFLIVYSCCLWPKHFCGIIHHYYEEIIMRPQCMVNPNTEQDLRHNHTNNYT